MRAYLDPSRGRWSASPRGIPRAHGADTPGPRPTQPMIRADRHKMTRHPSTSTACHPTDALRRNRGSSVSAGRSRLRRKCHVRETEQLCHRSETAEELLVSERGMCHERRDPTPRSPVIAPLSPPPRELIGSQIAVQRPRWARRTLALSRSALRRPRLPGLTPRILRLIAHSVCGISIESTMVAP